MVEELNKLWYSHTLEYYAAMKKDDKGLQELMWRDSQDILTNKRSKAQNSIYSMLSVMYERNGCKTMPDLDVSSHCLFMAS